MAATVPGIADLLQRAVDSGAVPGAAALVVERGGVVLHECAGVERSTGFRLASMTKSICSAAALQLVERGEISLDDPVERHLPDAAGWRVLDGWDGDVPRLREPRTPVTVRHLLTHTSGHGYFFLHPELARWHEVTGTPNVLTGRRAALDTPLVADPGTTWEYGTSTDWVGLLVEAVSGRRLDAYLDEHVFGPLGATSLTFAPADDLRERVLPIHHRTPDGGLTARGFDLPRSPEFWSAGGGLYGEAQDFGRFLAALLDDGAPLLEAATAELMFTDQLGEVSLPALMRSAAPELFNDVPAWPLRQGWGCGLHLLLEDVPGMRRAGSGDWAGLFNSYFWVDRAAGVAGAFFTQVLPFFDAQVVQTVGAFEQAVYAGRP